jgi:integrase
VECPDTFLYTSELIAANPMQLVGRPKLAKTLPKVLPAGLVAALLAKLNTDPQPRRRSDWVERGRALILTALLAGLRADELLRANVGDLRRSDDGAVIHVRGKWASTAGSQSNRRWWKFSSAIWVAGRPASLQPSDSAPPAGDWRSGRLLRRPDSPAIRRPTNGSRPGA